MWPRFYKACQAVLTVMDILVIFAWGLALFLGLVLVTFFGFHIYLLGKAYTTIEFCERRSSKSKSVEERYRVSPFQQGFCGNLCHLLGPNPLLWLLPVRWGMKGDGTSFKVRKDILETSASSKKHDVEADDEIRTA